MGWWRLRDSNSMVGDTPLDILGAAVSDIVAEYQREWHRRPTAAEWEGLIRLVLGNGDEDCLAVEEGAVVSVLLETKSA